MFTEVSMTDRIKMFGGSSSAVERQLPKLDATGSIPVSRSISYFETQLRHEARHSPLPNSCGWCVCERADQKTHHRCGVHRAASYLWRGRCDLRALSTNVSFWHG